MHSRIAILVAASLLLLSCKNEPSSVVGRPETDSKPILSEVLVVSRWQFVISEGYPSAETKTYKFFPDGRYEFVFRSDFQYSDSGTWQLLKQNDGHFLLELAKTHDEPGAHFLSSSTQIEYDSVADRLLVSGPQYADGVYLRHLTN